MHACSAHQLSPISPDMKRVTLIKKISVVCAVLIAAVTTLPAQSISPKTKLVIAIKGVPVEEQGQVNGQYVVSDSGYVRLPYLEKGLKASGISSDQLAQKIEAAYRTAQIYNNPRITVISNKDEEAQKIDAKLVHVGGFVKRPGPIQYVRGMTLFQALSAAGGEDTFGSIKRVELHRGGKRSVYDLKNNDRDMRVLVYPGDSINVPQKTAFGN